MRIALGSDHAGAELKAVLLQHLIDKGYECHDFGAAATERVNYPDYGEKVGRAVASGEYEKGLLVCGTGVGISIAANKVRGIRAVVCSEPYTALLSREHNDTNILAVGARVVGTELAKMILDVWLEGKFEGGRHQDRVNLISKIEQSNPEL